MHIVVAGDDQPVADIVATVDVVEVDFGVRRLDFDGVRTVVREIAGEVVIASRNLFGNQ